MRPHFIPAAVAVLLVSGAAPHLHAQRASFAAHSFAPVRVAPHAAAPRSLVSLHNSGAFRRSPRMFYPYGDLTNGFYGGDYSFPDAGPNPSDAQSSLAGPPVPWANMREEAPRPPVDPLVIELQGGHYVRVMENVTNGTAQLHDVSPAIVNTAVASSNHASAKSSALTPHAVAPAQLEPAVLVFRDGHNEEVCDYSIVDGIIYARGNLYTDGYWNKKIAVAALDVPETLKLNQTRGVAFQLPSAPNEVITRP